MPEIRQVQQVKIYMLVLNPMTGPAEAAEVVATSTSRDALIEYYNSNKATEAYYDEYDKNMWGQPYYKVFNKGSKLERYNPEDRITWDANHVSHYGHGIVYQWVDADQYNAIMNRPDFVMEFGTDGLLKDLLENPNS